MMQTQLKKIFSHVISWAVFIGYEASIIIGANMIFPNWQYLVYYIPHITLFYFSALIIYKKSYRKKYPFLFFIPGLGISLFLYTIVCQKIDDEVSIAKYGRIVPEEQNAASYILWRGVYFIGLATAYFFINRSSKRAKENFDLTLQKEREKRLRLESEHRATKAENAFLKAQIDTHLLFNSLNFIYADVEEKAPKAAEAVLLLSDSMRYALLDVREDGKVALSQELGQIDRYLKITKLRFGDNVCLDYTAELEANYSRAVILPLVLLTFIENTFKYAELTDPNNKAVIHLSHKNNTINLHIHNKKTTQLGIPSHGVGITNVRNRLNNHYSFDVYSIKIENTDTHYTLDFKLDL